MVQRTGRYLPCYKANIRQEVQSKQHVIIEKDALFCREAPDSKHYLAQDVNVWTMGYELEGMLNLKRGKKTSKVCLTSIMCFEKVSNDIFATLFEQGNFLAIEDDSLQQSIEYSGKSGSVLTFTYSEYKDKMARDAFTREFKVDLNDGKVAGFKGAVFEVISVDNVQIEYKVIRHFQ